MDNNLENSKLNEENNNGNNINLENSLYSNSTFNNSLSQNNINDLLEVNNMSINQNQALASLENNDNINSSSDITNNMVQNNVSNQIVNNINLNNNVEQKNMESNGVEQVSNIENNNTNKKNNSVILLILVIIVIVGVGIYFIINNKNDKNDENVNENPTSAVNNNETQNKKGKLVENVYIFGYMSSGNDKYIIVGLNEQDYENSDSYKCEDNCDLLKEFGNYKDDIQVNFYYEEEENEKKIVDYELYTRNTKEKIENIKTIEDLKNYLGYYTLGEHVEELTLISLDTTPGIAIENEKQYEYFEYVFKNSKGKELKMKYIINESSSSNSIKLEENKKYKVSFIVEKGIFDDDYKIINIQSLEN